MDWGLLLAVVPVLVLLVLIGLGLRFLIPILIDHLKGSFSGAGGWKALSRIYATSAKPEGEVLKRQSLVAGAVIYRYIVTVGLSEAGLYAAVGGPLPRPPILIPWSDFKNVEPVRLFWQKAALVSIGEPTTGSLTLPMSLYDRMRPYLPPKLASFGTPTKAA